MLPCFAAVYMLMGCSFYAQDELEESDESSVDEPLPAAEQGKEGEEEEEDDDASAAGGGGAGGGGDSSGEEYGFKGRPGKNYAKAEAALAERRAEAAAAAAAASQGGAAAESMDVDDEEGR